MDTSSAEIKMVVLKCLEIGYNTRAGATYALVVKNRHMKIKIDEKGDVSISGTMGNVTFNGRPALEGMGIKWKALSIGLKPKENGMIEYTGDIALWGGAAKIGVKGEFNLIEQLKAGTGLLGGALRDVDPASRRRRLDDEERRAVE